MTRNDGTDTPAPPPEIEPDTATCERCGRPDVIGLHDDDCRLPDPTETICPQCAGAGRLEGSGDTCGSCMGRGLHPVPLVDVFLAEHPDPGFTGPTPLTIDADGHIEGHVALASPHVLTESPDPLDEIYEVLTGLVETILGPATLNGPDPAYDLVLAAGLLCSHPEFTSKLDPGDLTGCDGCDRMYLEGPLSDWGLGWAVAYDSDGTPDVAICPVCCAENEDNDPHYFDDDRVGIEAIRLEEQAWLDGLSDGS